MKNQLRFAAALAAACAMSLSAAPALAAAPAQQPIPEVNSGLSPSYGVTVMATFSSQPNSYFAYREAVAKETAHMKAKNVILIASYRVMYGEMEKYFDVWWAPDYKTMTEAFYGSKNYQDMTPEEKAQGLEFYKKYFGQVLEPRFEIVSPERF